MVVAVASPRIDFRPLNAVGVWLRHYVAFRSGWLIETTGIVVEPAFILLAIGFGVGRFVNNIAPGMTYQEFVAPGIIMGSAMWHALFQCSWGAYQRMKTHHIYETMLVAPVNLTEIALGEIAWAATLSLMTTAAVLAAAAAFGLIDSAWAVFILPVGLITGLMFGGMGLVFASIAPSSHTLTLVFTMVGTPLFFASGAFFPISSLPDWVEPIAWSLPLTPATHAARAFATGEVAWINALQVLYVVGLALLFFAIAARLLRRKLIV